MKPLALFLIAAAVPLAGCTTDNMGMAANDRRSAEAMPAGDMTPTAAMSYIAMAGASDMYEIESSQLALAQSRSEAVRRFATMMIAHHQQTTQTLMTAARGAGLNPPPPMLMPMQRDMIAELRGLNGQAFDTAYLAQQRRAHDMALALHRTYAQRGDTPALRTVAASAVPIIEQHIAQLASM